MAVSTYREELKVLQFPLKIYCNYLLIFITVFLLIRKFSQNQIQPLLLLLKKLYMTIIISIEGKFSQKYL